jgi:hypothetical protein
MRSILSLLVALVFVLHSSWLMAAPAHACCNETDCPVTQCVSAGCLPGNLPAALDNTAAPAHVPASQPFAATAAPLLPHPAQEIWTPPD